MKKLRLNFTMKSILLLVLVGVVPLLATSVFSFYYAKLFFERTVFLNLERASEVLAMETENFMSQAHNNIATLQRNPVLASPNSSKEEKENELKKIHMYYQLFRDITILDATGETITSTTYRHYGKWSSNFWFLEAKENKEITASDMYAADDPREPILAFFAPVLDKENGKPLFFIAAQINTDLLFRLINYRVGEKGYAFLINSRGDIIAHPDQERLFDKISQDYDVEQSKELQKGIVEFTNDGKNSVASFRLIDSYDRYPGHGWQLIIAQPKKEAFAIFEEAKKYFLLFTVSWLAVIVAVSYYLGEKTAKPIREISDAAHEVAHGKMNTKVLVRTRDEIGDLAESFNSMTEKLEETYAKLEDAKADLEVKVEERNKNLIQLTANLENKIKERTRELLEKIKEVDTHGQARGTRLNFKLCLT